MSNLIHIYFGYSSGIDVLAKRDIPLRTKFGPFEGDLKVPSKMKLEKYRKATTEYPLLFLSRTSYLDVSNEHTSNWMRFVRIATDHQQQNVLLYEIDTKLYFRSCKFINPNEILCVGYSKDYAEKYNLIYLADLTRNKLSQTDEEQMIVDQIKFEETPTNEQSNESNASIGAVEMPTIETSSDNTPISPVKSKHRLNTGAIRKRKLELSKSARPTGPTVRYACCYCSKVFSKFLNYKKHTKRIHSVDIEHKRVTVDVEHKRVTIEDSTAGDFANEPNDGQSVEAKNIGEAKWFVCQTCERNFGSDEALQDHRKMNCDKKKSLLVQCNICSKYLQTPSALAMHLKSHSKANGMFKCPFCGEQYFSTLLFKDHVKCHNYNGFYSCMHCDKKFTKYAAVRKHMRMNHSIERFVCHECGKCFKTKYKLKEHSMRWVHLLPII